MRITILAAIDVLGEYGGVMGCCLRHVGGRACPAREWTPHQGSHGRAFDVLQEILLK